MDTETLLGIDAKLTLALLSSATALLVAVVGWWLNRGTSKALARLESELRQKETRADAKLAYEFEARKKLYHECEPLLFQLSDAAERAESRTTWRRPAGFAAARKFSSITTLSSGSGVA